MSDASVRKASPAPRPWVGPSRRTARIAAFNGLTLLMSGATIGSSLAQMALGDHGGWLVGALVAATACLVTTPLSLATSYRQDRRDAN